MGKIKKPIDDLCLLQGKMISDEIIVQQLKARHELNLPFTQLSDAILLIVSNDKNDMQDSYDHVTDYKNTSGGYTAIRSPHLFQTINQVYLHMRRTGIDQSIVLSGYTGKSIANNQIISHLVSLSSSSSGGASSHKKDKLATQIVNMTTVLTAFGLNSLNEQQFGQYTELQYNERGKIIGCKTIPYVFNKECLLTSGFDVLNILVNGSSAEEKQQLLLDGSFQYTSQIVNEDYVEKYEALKASLRHFGLGKKYHSRIIQVLAAILHLGELQFIDDAHQETPILKHADILEFVAELLGVDNSALTNVLVYKTQLINKDVTTIILNAEQAAIQRDQLVKTMYALLFEWILDHLNQKTCQQNAASFISLVDFPAKSVTEGDFNTFCMNYANERIQNYTARYLFESSGIEYSQDGFSYPAIDYHLNSIDLFDQPKTGLIDIINTCSKKTKADLIPMINKYQQENSDLLQTENGINAFSIQHYNSTVKYSTNQFMENNKDELNLDFINLFNQQSSTNSFIIDLFQSQRTPLKPVKIASNTTKKKSSSSSSLVLYQLRNSLDELFTAMDETMPWFIYYLNSGQLFDSQLVQSQIQAFQLSSIATRLKTGAYMNIFTHEEFCIRYHNILSTLGITEGRDFQSRCQATLDIFAWASTDAVVGSTKIFLNNNAWRQLEDELRVQEKEEQRQRKQERKNMAVGDDMSHVSSSIYSEQQQGMPSLNQRAMAAATASAVGLPMPRTNFGSHRMSDSERSFISEDIKCETDSQTASEHYGSNASIEMKNLPLEAAPEEEYQMSKVRKRWLFFVYFMTWWIPTPLMRCCGRMKRKDIQIAWREKVTLVMIIFLMSCFIIWFLVFFGKLICPHQDVFSQSELQASNGYVAIRGEVFDLSKFAPHHWANQVIPTSAIAAYAGKDASDLFPVQVSALCQGVTGTVSDYVSLDYHFNLTDPNSNYHDFRAWTDDPRPDWYFEKMVYLRKNYKIGTMGYTDKDIYRQATTPVDMAGVPNIRTWAVLNSSIYDLTYYLSGGRRVQLPTGMNASLADGVDVNYMADVVINLFRQKSGQDITKYWNALPLDPLVRQRQEVCLRNLFYVGALDQRNSPQCIFSEYLLLIVTVFLCSIIVFKFLAALQFTTRREPENHDKFVICQVPCYTEGEEELKKTIDSIAALHYDDKRKLLFIICDGMIIGGGNDRPTPRIVLDILGVDPHVDPEPLSFLSVGEGQKQHNMAKIYSGLYECQGHVVPYIVVSKVGKPSERQKPGNRGKRDSQLILMRFLNKVHFMSPMTPMELEIYHQIKNVIGVNPSFYEFVLMVDADTEVFSDGLNRLVSSFVHDAKVIGLCGETKLSNEKDSWVTMIQVYEYFISHYMIKAFESLFGSVTCLPGCFCMYRVRSPTKNQPLLVSNQVIEDYEINRVDTLHKKNLLHLGEDRYLTTLILKHFPTYKTKFVSDAKCATNAPDQWSILLSQRRRWINSTIHNLGELVFLPQLCGFCCFSMRFVVMLDLISTLVQPAIVGYLVYLIYTLATSTSNVPVMSMITIAGVYGLQAMIFILHKKWEHIIWMIVSIFAIPVFSLYIPIYAYWHFDDFSWGNTRVVLGDKGKKLVVGADEGSFDPRSIPTMAWDKYEEGLHDEQGAEDWKENDNASVRSKGSSYTQGSYISYQSQQLPPNYQSQNPFSHSPSMIIQPTYIPNNNSHMSMMSNGPMMYNNSHPSMMNGLNPSSPLHRYD